MADLIPKFSEEFIEKNDLNWTQESLEHFDEIARRLMGEEFWEAHRIPIVIQEVDVPNAFYHTQEHFIALSRGLLNLCENEDQLAWVLGHELGHYLRAVEEQEDHYNSKTEEGASDYEAVERMAKAGYKIRESTEMLKKLSDGRISNTSFFEHLDIHPTVSQRFSINEIAVTRARRLLRRNDIDAELVPTRSIPTFIGEISYKDYVQSRLDADGFEEKNRQEQFDYLVNLAVTLADTNDEDVRKKRIESFKNFLTDYLNKIDPNGNEEENGPRAELMDLFVRRAFSENLSRNEIISLRESMDVCEFIWREYHTATIQSKEVNTRTEEFKRKVREAQEKGEVIDLAELSKNYYLLNIHGSKFANDLFREGTVFSVPSTRTIKTDLFPGFQQVETEDIEDDDKLVFIGHGDSSFDCARFKIKNENQIELEDKAQTLDGLLSEQAHTKMAQALQMLHDAVKRIKTGEDVGLKLEQLDDLKRRLSPQVRKIERGDYWLFDIPSQRSPEERQEYLEKVLYPEQHPESPIAIGDDLFYRAVSTKHHDSENDMDSKVLFLDTMSFHRDVLLEKMTPEERLFWERYNAEANKIVWGHALSLIARSLKDGSLDSFPQIFRKNVSRGTQGPNQRLLLLKSDAVMAHLSNEERFSLLETFMENAPRTEDFLLNHTADFLYFTHKTLERYKESRPSEQIDEGYLNSAISYLRESMNIPENADTYDYVYQELKAFDSLPPEEKDKANRRVFYLDLLVSLQAIKKCEQPPWKITKQILEKNDPELKDDYAEAFFCTSEALFPTYEKDIFDKSIWPTDLEEYASYFPIPPSETQNSMYSKRPDSDLSQKDMSMDTQQEIAIAKDMRLHWIRLLEQEKDVDKIQAAWENSLFINGIIYSYTFASEFDAYSEKYLVHSPIWDKKRPLDKRMKVLFAIGTRKAFPRDGEAYHQLLLGLMNEVKQIKDAKLREQYAFKFVQLNIDKPAVHDFAEDLWVQSVRDILGRDDNSEKYFKEACVYVDKIQQKTADSDEDEDKSYVFSYVQRYSLGKKLAKALVSQRALSAELKPEEIDLVHLSAKETSRSHFGILLEGISESMLKGKTENIHAIIDFLRGEGTKKDCEEFGKKVLSWSEYGKDLDLNVYDYDMLYQKYWSLPQEAQGIFLNNLLKRCVKSDDLEEKNLKAFEEWKINFDYVMNEIFGQPDPNSASQNQAMSLARDFIWEYISARPDSERNLCLSVFLAAAGKKTSSEERGFEENIGMGLRKFLESMGSAGIKLGQALAVQTITPDYIRSQLQHFTSHALEPPRWEVFEWLKKYGEDHPEEAVAIPKELGEILGSASYFVTMGLSEEEVIKCLRIGAIVSAENEMDYVGKAVSRLIEKGKLTEHGEMLMRIVAQARDSIKIETDVKEAGYAQLQKAKEIYPTSVSMDGYDFDLRIADWHERGTKWARMERMPGVEFDEIESGPYKKALKKAYLSVELLNILSGREFDYDRHKGQMLIQKGKDNRSVIGLFDTGSMALQPPSPKDQEALGSLMYKTLEHFLREPDTPLGDILSHEFDEFYRQNPNTSSYITEVQRGLTVMGSYYENLTAKDWMDCCAAVLNNSQMPVSPHIINGFTREVVNSTGIFTASKNWTPEEKDNLGRLIFRVYASSTVHPEQDIQTTLIHESDNIPDSALGQFIKKQKDKKGSLPNLPTKVPAQFMEHICSLFKDESLDLLVAKGIAKEAFESINISNLQNRGTVEERQKIGSILCRAFANGDSTSSKLDVLNKELLAMGKTSDLARNMYAVLNFLTRSGTEEGDNISIVMDHLLQHGIDPDVKAGMEREAKGFKAKLFVTALDKGTKTSAVARTLFKVFTPRAKVKGEQTKSLQEMLDDAATWLASQPAEFLESPERQEAIRKRFVEPSNSMIRFKKARRVPSGGNG